MAFGSQLIEVHAWLRDELAHLRDDVDAYLDGGGVRPRELRAHCLTFCSALETHHTGEDHGAFPVLEDAYPELRPVLTQLRSDHGMMSWIIGKLEKLVDGLETAADPEAVRTELDGLAAVMETHFRYEEKKIVEALNGLDRPEWDGETPPFLQM
ncbi:hemerythrin domain-containing protein [Spirillospora sp. CA-294931]|uniref:hemerythrin domain-containing protein n=1 Tax=Spirillospora sp. CA-294931 TaxID=3240042 RepID=UPI003D937AC3